MNIQLKLKTIQFTIAPQQMKYLATHSSKHVHYIYAES